MSLPRTAIYALLAVSFALVFGLVGRINLAFGELAAVGSAATVAGAAVVAIGFGISAPLAGLTAGLVAALFAGALHGAVGGHFTIRRVTAQNTQPSLIAALMALIKASPFGRAWRAYADDSRAAALFGVDGPRLLVRTLALSGAMAGLSGMLIVPQ